jgi:hypothetical protein
MEFSRVKIDHELMNTVNNSKKKESQLRDYPESQVGFPERNDVTCPVDTERIHVDLDTFDISRKSSTEVHRELTGQSLDKR